VRNGIIRRLLDKAQGSLAPKEAMSCQDGLTESDHERSDVINLSTQMITRKPWTSRVRWFT